jgi:hypothetical protein
MSSNDSPYRRLPALAPTMLASALMMAEASRVVLSMPPNRNDDQVSEAIHPALPRPATAA